MYAAKDFIGKPVFSIDEGRRVGTVKDLYLDEDVRKIIGVYLGSDRLFSRKALCVERSNVQVFGVDAVLVSQSDAVVDGGPACETAGWTRRDTLQGYDISTTGGTKVGTVDDIILDDEMHVVGFSLGRVYVSGPVADHRAVAREAIIERHADNELLIVNLEAAERQTLTAT